MAGGAKRERQLARERYERQQQRRAAAVARRRRNQQIVAVVVAVLIVIGGIALLASKLGGNDATPAASKPTNSASPKSPSVSPSSSPTAAAGGCAYTKTAQTASKDVGLPTYDQTKAASYKQPFTATLKTNLGDIVIAMDAAAAPCTTNSFRHLAMSKFYDSTSCHRLTTTGLFVLQCGDPTGTGGGGPGYAFGVENGPAGLKYPIGTVAMARGTEPNTNGSQFFLVYKDTQLPNAGGAGYSILGTVTKGLDIVAKVAAAGSNNATGPGDGAPKMKVTIDSVTIGKS